MPLAGVEHGGKGLEKRIGAPGLGQPCLYGADLALRAVLIRRAERLAQQLRAETHADHGAPGFEIRADQPPLGGGVKIGAFLSRRGRALPAAEHDQPVRFRLLRHRLTEPAARDRNVVSVPLCPA